VIDLRPGASLASACHGVSYSPLVATGRQEEDRPIRAVIADPEAPPGWRIATITPPVPGPGELLVAPRHVSLNRGDLETLQSGATPPGAVLGRDLAGTVVRTVPGGPRVGSRVVALADGAFAARVAVAADAVAELPDEIELTDAAALPVAGLAAIQALRAGTLETPLRGARVLITGASGGVGRFAVQLAALGGGLVTAVAQPRHRASLVELGAESVVADPAEITEPVDLVLDTVGGAQLVAAWGLLAPGGTLQGIGWSSGSPACFPPHATRGLPRTLSTFLLTPPYGPDLAGLVSLVARNDLRVPVAWRGPLARLDEAASALWERRLAGKAVLTL
jgi:NADPH2:quinone reductase